jgi:molecular chaperone HscB
VQPPDRSADYFRVLGIERSFALDVGELERRYKELTKVLHPDRFARADPLARRASLERTVQLNEAWRMLIDPVRRAEYLLSFHGIVLGQSTGQFAEHPTVPVPEALLMEVLELREALAEAHTANDLPRVQLLAAKVRTSFDAAMADVAQSFAKLPPDLKTIVRQLSAVRYYRRFLDEARSLLEDPARFKESPGHAG